MRIVHLCLNSFRHPSRELRSIDAARGIWPDTEVLVLAINDPGDETVERRDARTTIRRIVIKTRGLDKSLVMQFVKYVEWASHAIVLGRRFAPDIIQVHSLSALPIGIAMRGFTRAKVVYDAHELETERNGLGGVRKVMAKALERLCLPFADATLVVGERIAQWYREAYPGREFTVVRNISEETQQTTQPPFDLRAKIGAAPDDMIFLYLGGIAQGRGVPLLLDAFARLPPDHRLAVMGQGVLEPLVREAAAKHSNISLVSPVLPSEVVATARAADAGLSLLEGEALNQRFAMPNKLFQCISAGLPVVIGDNCPEMADAIEQYGSGWLVPRDVDALVAALAAIDRNAIAAKKAIVASRPATPQWADEEVKLQQVYRDLVAGGAH